jgi:hypothetical protein
MSWLFDGKIAGLFGTFENFVDESSCPAQQTSARATACVAASECYLPATDCSPINASCDPILKSEPHRVARANIAGFPRLIGLRFLTSWSHELGTDFSSTLIA